MSRASALGNVGQTQHPEVGPTAVSHRQGLGQPRPKASWGREDHRRHTGVVDRAGRGRPRRCRCVRPPALRLPTTQTNRGVPVTSVAAEDSRMGWCAAPRRRGRSRPHSVRPGQVPALARRCGAVTRSPLASCARPRGVRRLWSRRSAPCRTRPRWRVRRPPWSPRRRTPDAMRRRPRCRLSRPTGAARRGGGGLGLLQAPPPMTTGEMGSSVSSIAVGEVSQFHLIQPSNSERTARHRWRSGRRRRQWLPSTVRALLVRDPSHREGTSIRRRQPRRCTWPAAAARRAHSSARPARPDRSTGPCGHPDSRSRGAGQRRVPGGCRGDQDFGGTHPAFTQVPPNVAYSTSTADLT